MKRKRVGAEQRSNLTDLTQQRMNMMSCKRNRKQDLVFKALMVGLASLLLMLAGSATSTLAGGKPPPGFLLVLVQGQATMCADGEPVQGAQVILFSKKKPDLKVATTTNSEGKFSATAILFGAHVQAALADLRVEFPGFTVGNMSSIVVTLPFVGTFISIDVCVNPVLLDLQIFKVRRDDRTLQEQDIKLGNDEEGEPADEFTIGSQNCVNNDNDDSTSNFDRDKPTVLIPDNDLIKLVVKKPLGVTEGLVILGLSYEPEGTGRVRVWESRTKGAEVTLPKAYFVHELDKVLWVEGIAPSKAQRDVVFVLFGDGPLAAAKPDFVRMTVIGVDEAIFIGKGNSVNDDEKLDKNIYTDVDDGGRPTAELGVRVFPDKRLNGSGAGARPEITARDKVKVKIKLTVAVPHPDGLKIYVRPMDVDDPSSAAGPVDPNDALADTGAGDNAVKGYYDPPGNTIPYTQHEDNRGNVDGFKAGKLLPGADVEVVEEGPFFGERYTLAKLLFKQGEQEKDVLEFQVTKQPGDNFRLGLTCDDLFLRAAINQDNRGHRAGIRNFPADKEIEWQSPVLTVWRFLYVEVDSMGEPPMGTAFDADDLLHGDVPEPDTSGLAAAFDDVFVDVIVGNRWSTKGGTATGSPWDNSSTPWSQNFGLSKPDARIYVRDQRRIPSEPDFWGVYVLGAYEIWDDSWDNDPEDEVGVSGSTLPDDGTTDPSPEQSVIFMETIRDRAAQWGWDEEQRTKADSGTVIHELGHHFEIGHQGAHDPDNPGACTGAPDNVMWAPCKDDDEESLGNRSLYFSTGHINELRAYKKAP